MSKWQYISAKNRPKVQMNWFAKTLFKDCLPVYERVNIIDQTFQIFIWYLLCSLRQWSICYLFINLANNRLLIFWSLIKFYYNKILELWKVHSGTESNIHKRDFLQEYLATLTVNYFRQEALIEKGWQALNLNK